MYYHAVGRTISLGAKNSFYRMLSYDDFMDIFSLYTAYSCFDSLEEALNVYDWNTNGKVMCFS